jgi:UDP-N-acetylmuramoyl-tripeptide--D-alanyl-D-alanine ligase
MKFFDSLEEISKITEARLVNINNQISNQKVRGISTDSRHLKRGEIFVALQGDRFDGHNFIEQAISKGAIATIINQNNSLTSAPNIPQLQVKDTLEAYQKIARWWRNKFSIPVIAVTGSVGKTTTKELMAAVLSTQGEVLKTEANYNNEIGVPKTLLKLANKHQYAVIEMAMRGRGEIGLLTEIASPIVGVITNVGTAHIGRLGSREAIASAKCELLAKMTSAGVAILNHDCPLLLETAAKVWSGETITYGLQGGDLQGEIIDSGTIKVDGQQLPLPLKGSHNALNYLAAIAVAKLLGLDLSGLERPITVNLPEGRAHHYRLSGDVEILDETYNAGLESMLASLHLLRETPGRRKIAVLGAMKELGEHSLQLHRQVGEVVKRLGIDGLLVLGDDGEAEAIARGAVGVSTEIFSFHEDLMKKLLEIVQPGDRFLFKASHSVGLNRVVEGFCQQWEALILT